MLVGNNPALVLFVSVVVALVEVAVSRLLVILVMSANLPNLRG